MQRLSKGLDLGGLARTEQCQLACCVGSCGSHKVTAAMIHAQRAATILVCQDVHVQLSLKHLLLQLVGNQFSSIVPVALRQAIKCGCNTCMRAGSAIGCRLPACMRLCDPAGICTGHKPAQCSEACGLYGNTLKPAFQAIMAADMPSCIAFAQACAGCHSCLTGHSKIQYFASLSVKVGSVRQPWSCTLPCLSTSAWTFVASALRLALLSQ